MKKKEMRMETRTIPAAAEDITVHDHDLFLDSSICPVTLLRNADLLSGHALPRHSKLGRVRKYCSCSKYWRPFTHA